MQLPLFENLKQPSLPLVAGIAVAAVGLLGLGAVAVDRFKPRQTIDLDKYTVPIKAEDLSVKISASGSILPFQSVNLSPKTAGRVAQLFVEQGDVVKQGQKIALMENAELQAQYLQALANLQQAQANLAKGKNARPEEVAQSEAKLAQAQANLAKVKNGSRPQEIGQASAKLQQAQANLNLARSIAPQRVRQAQAQVAAAQAKLKLARSQSERYKSLLFSGAVARDKVEQSIADYQTATANLLEAQQKLQQVQVDTQQEIIQRQAAVAEVQQVFQQTSIGSRPEDIANAAAQVKQAEYALKQSKSARPEEIAQLTAAVNVAKAQVSAAQSQFQDSVVVAPFSGMITQRYTSVGAFVTPTTSASTSTSATSTSIVAIARDLEVKAKVPEADIGKIKVGQKVEINADAYPDRPFQGTVRLIAPEAVLEQNVTSFEVRVSIDTGKDALKSGMNVNSVFQGEKINNALLIPTVAIVSKRGQSGAYIADENNEPKLKLIKAGNSIKDKTQILEGLKSGDRVFIDIPKGFKDKMLKDEK
jgi:HlyD family secretion protein